MKASVIICTYNRSALLKEALVSMMDQSFPPDEIEIIVVDNNSTDDTKPVVKEIAASSAVKVSCVTEEKQGLSHARNRGIAVARGEFIAFIDDDAAPERNWLEKLEEGFSDPVVACVGGKVIPAWKNLSGWPAWLHERLICFFTVVDYGERKTLHYPDYPAGTNIAFRKKVFAEIGGFNAELGRTGESLLSGEETDLCLRVERAGYRIAYVPEAVVHHSVHEKRLTRAWVRERSRFQGISAAVIERERFGALHIAAKSLKYLFFIMIGMAGTLFFSVIRDEKRSFFCRCQVVLCTAYLGKVWGWR